MHLKSLGLLYVEGQTVNSAYYHEPAFEVSDNVKVMSLPLGGHELVKMGEGSQPPLHGPPLSTFGPQMSPILPAYNTYLLVKSAVDSMSVSVGSEMNMSI